ncbi:MAG: hypothetical protein Q7O66_08105, partial [Dehalococcoidia bacterium]|nr:hypothetical protein [Dehalococcoidia bacterium]
IFAVADPDVAVFMLLMMLSLIVLMGFLAIVVPRVNNAIYKSHPGEAVITMRTLYIGGRLHTWGMLGFGLEGAILQKGPWDYIEIAYSYPSSPTPQIEVVRVPVPPGGEEEAQRVVSQLLGQMVAPPAG